MARRRLCRADKDRKERPWKQNGSWPCGVPPTLWLAGGGPKVREAIGRGADGWLYTRGGTLGRPEVIADRLRTLLRARFPELAQLAR
jgi:hypothetical protein